MVFITEHTVTQWLCVAPLVLKHGREQPLSLKVSNPCYHKNKGEKNGTTDSVDEYSRVCEHQRLSIPTQNACVHDPSKATNAADTGLR